MTTIKVTLLMTLFTSDEQFPTLPTAQRGQLRSLYAHGLGDWGPVRPPISDPSHIERAESYPLPRTFPVISSPPQLQELGILLTPFHR